MYDLPLNWQVNPSTEHDDSLKGWPIASSPGWVWVSPFSLPSGCAPSPHPAVADPQGSGTRLEAHGDMLRVRDIMTSRVVMVGVDDPAPAAADFLLHRGIGGAPVCDREGHLVGMLSKTDLITGQKGSAESRDAGARVDDLSQSQTKVADIMTPNVLSLLADDPALLAAKGLAASQIHRAVVFDLDGNLAGIVTSMDIVRAVASGARFDDTFDDADPGASP
jgi:CBS domain-containing protein